MKWALRKRGEHYSIRVFIPKELQHLHLSKSGKPKAELQEALHTSDRAEANRLAVERIPELTRKVYKLPDPSEFKYEKPLTVRAVDERTGRAVAYEETYSEAAFEVAEQIEKVHGPRMARDWMREVKAPLSLALAPDEYRKHVDLQGKKAPRTRDMQQREQRKFAEWWWDSSGPLKDVTVTDADAYVQHLTDQGYAPGSINKAVNALSVLWEWARRRGHVETNVWQGQGVDKAKVREVRPFTPDEVKQVRTHLEQEPDARHLDLFTLLLFTGCRIEEVCSLRVRQITRDKDGAVTGFTAEEGKAGAGSRHWIPVVHPDAVSILTRRTEGKQSDELLFNELVKGKQGWSHNIAKTLRARIRKALGFPLEGACPVDNHSLRRVHATAGENAGLLPEEINRLQRRKSGDIAIAVYSEGPYAERKTELQSRVTQEIGTRYWSSLGT